jgi:vitamin B12 transporter
VYETRIKDLIGFDTNAPRNSVNVGRASINGIEVEWSNQWGPWQASANLTAQKAINLDTNTDLLRRPRRKLSTRVGHDIGTRGQANIEIVARSDFRDFGAFAEEDVPGSGVVNLDGYYEFAPQWRAEIRIENLLDKNYEIVRGFSTAERSAYVAVRYAMGG